MAERQRVLITGRVVEIYNGNEVASYPICHVATICGRVYLFIITSDLLVTVVDTSLCFLMNQLFVFFGVSFEGSFSDSL
jgi:hypothetical protein